MQYCNVIYSKLRIFKNEISNIEVTPDSRTIRILLKLFSGIILKLAMITNVKVFFPRSETKIPGYTILDHIDAVDGSELQ